MSKNFSGSVLENRANLTPYQILADGLCSFLNTTVRKKFKGDVSAEKLLDIIARLTHERVMQCEANLLSTEAGQREAAEIHAWVLDELALEDVSA